MITWINVHVRNHTTPRAIWFFAGTQGNAYADLASATVTTSNTVIYPKGASHHLASPFFYCLFHFNIVDWLRYGWWKIHRFHTVFIIFLLYGFLACVSLTPHLGGVSAGIKVPEIQGKDNPCCLPPNKGGQVAKKSSPAPVKAQTGANRPNGKAWKKYIWTVVFNERRNRHKMIRIPNPRLKSGS